MTLLEQLQRAGIRRVGSPKMGFRFVTSKGKTLTADEAERCRKLGRAAVNRDLKRPGRGREKVMACILKVLSTCFIRPGSQEYAAENGSYGLATLRRKQRLVHLPLGALELRAGQDGGAVRQVSR